MGDIKMGEVWSLIGILVKGIMSLIQNKNWDRIERVCEIIEPDKQLRSKIAFYLAQAKAWSEFASRDYDKEVK